jgi:hypothetical protein
VRRSPVGHVIQFRGNIPGTGSGLKQWCRATSNVSFASGYSHTNMNESPTSAYLFERVSIIYSFMIDRNANNDFFKFTRDRFVVDELKTLRQREVQFDLNRLASVAADSVGAAQCISVKEYPDGMFNKAYLMSMDNGREVVAKVPNPNAGIPHFTTASEVATMNFVCLIYTLSH